VTAPVRVLHLIDGLGSGGSERLVWDTVRLTKRDAAEYTVLTVVSESRDFVYAPRMRAAGVYRQSLGPAWLRRFSEWRASIRPGLGRRILFAPFLLLNVGFFVGELVAAVKAERPHVIHAHTFFGFLAGLVASVLLGIPLVHSVPGTFHQLRDVRVGWMIWCYRRLHGLVHVFFTGMPVELMSVGVPPEKIRPLRSLVDLKALEAERDKLDDAYRSCRFALGLTSDSLIALSVGRLHTSKGHHCVIEALPQLLRKLPGLHWVVLGDGTERDRLMQRAEELGVTEHIHLLGFQPDPTKYYAAADIYLRTMLMESENLSSYHAMALGVPVIGFDTRVETELLDTVGHGQLVPVGSSVALADAVARILELPDRGASLGQRGAQFCAAHLDLDFTITDLVETYRQLAHESLQMTRDAK